MGERKRTARRCLSVHGARPSGCFSVSRPRIAHRRVSHRRPPPSVNGYELHHGRPASVRCLAQGRHPDVRQGARSKGRSWPDSARQLQKVPCKAGCLPMVARHWCRCRLSAGPCFMLHLVMPRENAKVLGFWVSLCRTAESCPYRADSHPRIFTAIRRGLSPLHPAATQRRPRRCRDVWIEWP